jgi:hypothetical protein
MRQIMARFAFRIPTDKLERMQQAAHTLSGTRAAFRAFGRQCVLASGTAKAFGEAIARYNARDEMGESNAHGE